MQKQAAVATLKRRIVLLSGIVCLLAAGFVAGAKIKPHVYPQECVGCGDCVVVCPKKGKAVHIVRGKAIINPESCIACNKCVDICSYGAVRR